nr:MAG TPA: hypothetical protein [Caudoviricetes sp.]
MAIKNYTTKIDVYTSLGEIQRALAKGGARKIMVDYNEAGLPAGVTFGLLIDGRVLGFQLPAHVDGVEAVFKQQRIKADRQQAERTAWRNIRDWVLAQMAFVEAGNVQTDEVFLPYLVDGRGTTLYTAFHSGQLSLPGMKEEQ